MKVYLVSLLFCSSATHAFSFRGLHFPEGSNTRIVKVPTPVPEVLELEISSSK